MSTLSSNILVNPQDLYTSSSTQGTNLGAMATTGDGRFFRYSLAGASALVQGKLYQAPAQITNHQNLTPTATAIGATSITTTLGATAATANQYAGGWVVVTVTPGEGYQYQISGNPAISSAGTGAINLADPILVALTTSSRIDLVLNPLSGVIVNPTTATAAAKGVAVYPVAAAQYGWLQVGGVASVLADGAITVGTNVIASNAVAGAVEPGADAADLQANIGIAVTGIADTEYGAIDLHLM